MNFERKEAIHARALLFFSCGLLSTPSAQLTPEYSSCFEMPGRPLLVSRPVCRATKHRSWPQKRRCFPTLVDKKPYHRILFSLPHRIGCSEPKTVSLDNYVGDFSTNRRSTEPRSVYGNPRNREGTGGGFCHATPKSSQAHARRTKGEHHTKKKEDSKKKNTPHYPPPQDFSLASSLPLPLTAVQTAPAGSLSHFPPKHRQG